MLNTLLLPLLLLCIYSPTVRTAWCSPIDSPRSRLSPVSSGSVLSTEAVNSPGLSILVAHLRELYFKMPTSRTKPVKWYHNLGVEHSQWWSEYGDQVWDLGVALVPKLSITLILHLTSMLLSHSLSNWLVFLKLGAWFISLITRFFPQVLPEWGPTLFLSSIHLPLPRTKGKFLRTSNPAAQPLWCWLSPSSLLWDFLPPSSLDLADRVLLSGWTLLGHLPTCPLDTMLWMDQMGFFASVVGFHITNLMTFKRLSFALRSCLSSLSDVIMTFLLRNDGDGRWQLHLGKIFKKWKILSQVISTSKEQFNHDGQVLFLDLRTFLPTWPPYYQ